MSQKISSNSDFLNEKLQVEILKSESIRIRIMQIMFLAATIAWGIVYLFFQQQMNDIVGETFPVFSVLVIFAVWSLYETMVLLALQRMESRGIFLETIRYLNAAIETSLPTTLIYFLFLATDDFLLAMHSPPHLIYFIMIILSILRLNFSLSLFTGLVAFVEYFGISMVLLPEIDSSHLPHYLVSLYAFAGRGGLFLVSGAVAGFVGSQLHKRIVASLESLEERNEIVNMFGSYVSPAVVEKLLAQKSDLESETRHVCVLFLDIRNFTSFSEKRNPGEVISYLNEFFGHLVDIVNQNKGIVNKFLGDGFMAVFGAPMSDGNQDVHNAVRAALTMKEKIRELNEKRIIPETQIGIGLHAGPAVTGNVGSNDRKEYTIIGDTVNLASRVEQLNKEFGSAILATDSVFEIVKGEIHGTELPPAMVKGRKEPVIVYQLD